MIFCLPRSKKGVVVVLKKEKVMVIQLLILSLFFSGLAGWFFYRKKHVLGVTFLMIAFAAVVLFFVVRAMYPQSVPF